MLISFKAIDLEPGHDFIYLYDGGRRSSEPLNNLTGTSIPYDMIMERSFVVVFISDHRVRRQGFYMYFQTYQGTNYISSIPVIEHQPVSSLDYRAITLLVDPVS